MTKRQTILILIAAVLPLIFMYLYRFIWSSWDAGDRGDGYVGVVIPSCIVAMVAVLMIAFNEPQKRE